MNATSRGNSVSGVDFFDGFAMFPGDTMPSGNRSGNHLGRDPNMPPATMSPVHMGMHSSQHGMNNMHHMHHMSHQDHYGAFVTPALPPQSLLPTSARKRRVSEHSEPHMMQAPSSATSSAFAESDVYGNASHEPPMSPPVPKKTRTNTPWTPAEEQRLKTMRDAGNSWNEIAKSFPARTEGSVKKHWYKDMHYAEFAEDESAALLAAIKEYEASKWKIIGQKLGKPAKACEQYAREHFGGKV